MGKQNIVSLQWVVWRKNKKAKEMFVQEKNKVSFSNWKLKILACFTKTFDQDIFLRFSHFTKSVSKSTDIY